MKLLGPALLVLAGCLVAPGHGSEDACTYAPDTDYSCTWGDTTKVGSKEACCTACKANPLCLAGTYQPKAGGDECYLKGGVIKAHSKPGVTGCVARAPPPPAPVFDCGKEAAKCAGRLGATHWNPCYFLNASEPVLLDGASALAGMGSKVIKVALFDPLGNYPFNSPNWAKSYPTLLSMAKDPYYQRLWEMPQYDSYVLIAYSTVGGDAGGSISYWVDGITAKQAAEETAQLKATALFFLEKYAALGKTFVFENWEGDWASRGSGYDGNKPATPLALASMRTWLMARQAGVTAARAEFEASQRVAGNWWLTGLPTLGNAANDHGGSGGVYFAAEVNLVDMSMTTGFPNMVNRVVPYVALDMISYSSYDTQTDPVKLAKALAFIAAHHNKTAAAPTAPGAAVFVAEYGLAQNEVSNTTLLKTLSTVVDTALAFGCPYVMFWETYDNECTGEIAGCSGGRCHDPANPVTDPEHLHGFWLLRPDGSKSAAYTYLAGKIGEGSEPTTTSSNSSSSDIGSDSTM